MKKRVIFRADGNAAIGYGHFIRTLGIAGLINQDFECLYATTAPTPYQLEEIAKVCRSVIPLSDGEQQFGEFLEVLQPGDIVVIDDYHSTSEYQLAIREKGCKVVYIDDHNDKHYVCDALINNIPGFARDSFDKEDYTRLYLGTDYALLRKEFFDPELKKIAKRENSIFLAFGGADIFNISEKVIGFLNELDPTLEMHLLIGDAYKYHDRLKKFSNLETHKNVSAAEVARLIAASGTCIVPASSLLNETASVGSKILAGYFADNQLQPYRYFTDHHLAIGLGDYRTLDFGLFRTQFEKIRQDQTLIENQRRIYHNQQEENLKNIFYNV